MEKSGKENEESKTESKSVKGREMEMQKKRRPLRGKHMQGKRRMSVNKMPSPCRDRQTQCEDFWPFLLFFQVVSKAPVASPLVQTCFF